MGLWSIILCGTFQILVLGAFCPSMCFPFSNTPDSDEWVAEDGLLSQVCWSRETSGTCRTGRLKNTDLVCGLLCSAHTDAFGQKTFKPYGFHLFGVWLFVHVWEQTLGTMLHNSFLYKFFILILWESLSCTIHLQHIDVPVCFLLTRVSIFFIS